MNTGEKIKYVKDLISERVKLSPPGPIHLTLYTVTEYEEGPTLISRGEQGSILRKLEDEGVIAHLEFDQDKCGAWLEIVPPQKSQIKLKVVEFIAKKLAEAFTTQEIISTLIDFGIPREDIPNTSKWRIIFEVIQNYATSPVPSRQDRVYGIITTFLHPINFDPDLNINNKISDGLAGEFNKYLRYDGLKVVPEKDGDGYEITPLVSAKSAATDQNKLLHTENNVGTEHVEVEHPQHNKMIAWDERATDLESDSKEQVAHETGMLRSPRGAEEIAIVRKAYLTLMNIAEVFSFDPSKPTRELNTSYTELSSIVEKALESFTGDTSEFEVFTFDDFKKINYGLPFANLYSAEHDFKRIGQTLSWDNIRPAMNAVLGRIEVLCETANAGDVIGDPKIQKLIGDTQLILSNIVAERKKNLGAQPEKVLKMELTKMPELQVRNVDDTFIAKGKKRLHLPKFSQTDWAKITIRFIDAQNVLITADKKQVPSDYAALGFADDKRDQPNTAWEFLRGLAENNGETKTLPKPIPDVIKQQKLKLADRLKTIFKNDTDPFYDPTESRTYRIKIALIPPQSADAPDKLGVREYLAEEMTEVYDE